MNKKKFERKNEKGGTHRRKKDKNNERRKERKIIFRHEKIRMRRRKKEREDNGNIIKRSGKIHREGRGKEGKRIEERQIMNNFFLRKDKHKHPRHREI